MSLGQSICLIPKLQLHTFWKICPPHPAHYCYDLSPLHIFLGQLCLSTSPWGVITLLLLFKRKEKTSRRKMHTVNPEAKVLLSRGRILCEADLSSQNRWQNPALSSPCLAASAILSFDANLLGCKPAAQFCKVQEPRWPICSAQPAEGARTLWREGWNSHSGWLPPRSSLPHQLQADSGKMGCLSWTE